VPKVSRWVPQRGSPRSGSDLVIPLGCHTQEWLNQLLEEETAKIANQLGKDKFAASKFALARVRFAQTLQPEFVDFLTTLCYNDIVTVDPAAVGGRKANL